MMKILFILSLMMASPTASAFVNNFDISNISGFQISCKEPYPAQCIFPPDAQKDFVTATWSTEVAFDGVTFQATSLLDQVTSNKCSSPLYNCIVACDSQCACQTGTVDYIPFDATNTSFTIRLTANGGQCPIVSTNAPFPTTSPTPSSSTKFPVFSPTSKTEGRTGSTSLSLLVGLLVTFTSFQAV